MDDLETMLEGAYRDALQAVSDAKSKTDEATWELQKMTAMHKQLMDLRHADGEAGARFDELTMKQKEMRMKEEQLKDGKKDRIIKCVFDGAVILVPAMVSSYWMAKGLQFEKDGSFTSRTGQWLSNHLRLFKK